MARIAVVQEVTPPSPVGPAVGWQRGWSSRSSSPRRTRPPAPRTTTPLPSRPPPGPTPVPLPPPTLPRASGGLRTHGERGAGSTPAHWDRGGDCWSSWRHSQGYSSKGFFPGICTGPEECAGTLVTILEIVNLKWPSPTPLPVFSNIFSQVPAPGCFFLRGVMIPKFEFRSTWWRMHGPPQMSSNQFTQFGCFFPGHV